MKKKYRVVWTPLTGGTMRTSIFHSAFINSFLAKLNKKVIVIDIQEVVLKTVV